MAVTRTLAQAFVGGELSPEFFGRISDAKFQEGAASMRNFLALPHGPAQNRGGFSFVREVKNSAAVTRLLPFTYSTTQTMVLEFGNLYIRFHTNGAYLTWVGSTTVWSGGPTYLPGALVTYGGHTYLCTAQTNGVAPAGDVTHWYQEPDTGELEIATPYLTADLFNIHYVQSADVLTLVHPGYPPAELRRYGALDWRYTTIAFATTMSAPTGVKAAATNGATTPYSLHEYVVTSVATNGDESLQSAPASSGNATALTAVTQAVPGVFTLTSYANGLFSGQLVTITGVVGMTQLNGNTYTVDTVNSSPRNYGEYISAAVTTVTLKNMDGTSLDTTLFTAYVSGGVFTLSGVQNNLAATGSYNSLSWTPVAGAAQYNVYKRSHGLWSYIGSTTTAGFKDDFIAPNSASPPPTASNPFASAGNYPGAVSYFEQRRWFAGTTNLPQSLWGTKSGTEANLNYSIPSQSTDSLAIKVAARESNTIRHLVPLQQLIPLTSAAEWRVASVNSDAITPFSISVKPQSFIGASNVQPLIINNSLIYVAARGGHMREMGYNWQANGYITGDLSLRATHLFDTYDIVDMCYSKSPYPLVWAVSTTGQLVGLTYIPEQQIGAWHHHDTINGVFEACTCVAEGAVDVLYVIVRRTINGVTKRYIERMASRIFAGIANAFFVDCGATYNGAPATTVSGLVWLEGQTVSILADGAVQPQVVVTGGVITIPQAASVITIGLPITADLQTLPLVVAQVPGGAQGRPRNVNKAFVRVSNSRSVKAGPDANSLIEDIERTTELYGSPPNLQSGELEIPLLPTWHNTGQILVRQDQPLPCTIDSICYEVALGG